MDKFDRIQLLHRELRSRKWPVPISILAECLECSPKTVQCSIDNLRYYLDAPLGYDPSQKGWYYNELPGNRFELPGLWLTSAELQALSFLLNLLEELGSSFIHDELGAIKTDIKKLLKARGISVGQFSEQIKILSMAHQPLPQKSLLAVSEALMNNQCLDITYLSYTNAKTIRRLSPQQLIHYRENWYLDAWCHLRNGLRTFPIARMESASVVSEAAKKVNKEQLKKHFQQGYGIFSGEAKHTAWLRFGQAITREIATQQWHPAADFKAVVASS